MPLGVKRTVLRLVGVVSTVTRWVIGNVLFLMTICWSPFRFVNTLTTCSNYSNCSISSWHFPTSTNYGCIDLTHFHHLVKIRVSYIIVWVVNKTLPHQPEWSSKSCSIMWTRWPSAQNKGLSFLFFYLSIRLYTANKNVRKSKYRW